MNEALQVFVKKELRNGLKQCTKEQVQMFKLIYAPKNSDWTIKQVVASMPENRLDSAMEQVARAIKNNQGNNS